MNDKSSFAKVPLVITKPLLITKQLKLYFTILQEYTNSVLLQQQWWNSERFVVITRQLQAAKCSLSRQLFHHIFNLSGFDTVALNVKKCLLDLFALHWAYACVKHQAC
jgi:hypothetical protein